MHHTLEQTQIDAIIFLSISNMKIKSCAKIVFSLLCLYFLEEFDAKFLNVKVSDMVGHNRAIKVHGNPEGDGANPDCQAWDCPKGETYLESKISHILAFYYLFTIHRLDTSFMFNIFLDILMSF